METNKNWFRTFANSRVKAINWNILRECNDWIGRKLHSKSTRQKNVSSGLESIWKWFAPFARSMKYYSTLKRKLNESHSKNHWIAISCLCRISCRKQNRAEISWVFDRRFGKCLKILRWLFALSIAIGQQNEELGWSVQKSVAQRTWKVWEKIERGLRRIQQTENGIPVSVVLILNGQQNDFVL